MMSDYYVNRNAQRNGEHEVHEATCYWLTLVRSRLFLGAFATCNGAVTKAKQTYPTANGCFHCSPNCHTS